MGISTVSFDKARIYKDKMFFALNGKNGMCTTVFDSHGIALVQRVSHKAVKTITDDCIIITRKNEYKISGNNIFFELIKRIYDKAGKLIKTEKTFI